MTTSTEERSSAGQREYRRTAFGLPLSIDARIPIAGLGRSSASVSTRPPSRIRLDADELRRRWGALDTAPMRARELRVGETLRLSVDFAEPAGYLLWAKEFGLTLISPDGTELLCDPDPTKQGWERILVGQALPLAATIRGLEVFHASAIVLDDRAVLFAGPVGAGKSSLAAAFVRAGAQLLTDDAAALELDGETLVTHAGSAVLQLRDTEDQALSGQERAALGDPKLSTAGKQRYLGERASSPVPLGALFLLERSTDEPAVEQLAAVKPFELIASTFNLSVRTPARLLRQLDVVSAIASLGLAHRLRVQPNLGAAELAGIVQAQLAAPIS